MRQILKFQFEVEFHLVAPKPRSGLGGSEIRGAYVLLPRVLLASVPPGFKPMAVGAPWWERRTLGSLDPRGRRKVVSHALPWWVAVVRLSSVCLVVGLSWPGRVGLEALGPEGQTGAPDAARWPEGPSVALAAWERPSGGAGAVRHGAAARGPRGPSALRRPWPVGRCGWSRACAPLLGIEKGARARNGARERGIALGWPVWAREHGIAFRSPV